MDRLTLLAALACCKVLSDADGCSDCPLRREIGCIRKMAAAAFELLTEDKHGTDA